jgi:RecB family exonuclease
VPAADPDRRWGAAPETRSELPIAPEGHPVRLSGSTLRDLGACPAKWLLGHEVRAEGARTSALGFGSVVHALAEAVTDGTLPADLDVLMARLDVVWHQLDFVAPWQSAIEHEAARDALRRFLTWHRAKEDDGRKPLATEERFVVDLTVADREVTLRGAIDRIDLDADGRVVVVDYKTGRHQPTKAEVAVDPQLGAYQYAVETGALDHVVGDVGTHELGGAELVQLRQERKGGLPQVQPQAPLRAAAVGRADADGPDGSAWFDRLLESATTKVVLEQLPAVPGPACATCAFIASCPSQPTGRQVIP